MLGCTPTDKPSNKEAFMPDRIWRGKRWDQLTPDERIEYLVEWCENLTQQVQRQGEYINGLHSRLTQVEDRNKSAAS
jgi:hypothetical protein